MGLGGSMSDVDESWYYDPSYELAKIMHISGAEIVKFAEFMDREFDRYNFVVFPGNPLLSSPEVNPHIKSWFCRSRWDFPIKCNIYSIKAPQSPRVFEFQDMCMQVIDTIRDLQGVQPMNHRDR